jgi:hypothetical protein
MSKFTAPIHEPPPDPKVVADRLAKRRCADKVDELEQGFTFRPSGRDGYIYFRRGEKLLELYWEMSGVDDYDILLSLEGLQQWVLPQSEPLASEQRAEIRTELQSWLAANNVRALLQETEMERGER